MITTEGSLHIKRFLSGAAGSIGRSVALGVGTAAEAVGNTTLDYEVARADVTLLSYDYVNNKLVFKAAFPENLIGTFHEVGLWSLPASYLASDFGSRNISTFDAGEGWTGTLSATAARIGSEALQQTPAASATTTNVLTGLTFDLSGYSAADEFVFAFNVGNAFSSQVLIRFLTDSSNYYTFSLGAQTAGYKVVRRAKNTATVTGAPDWSNINEIQVATTSTAGGASAVSFDGIRLEDKDTYVKDNILVARELLSTPFTKTETMPQDVEFSLAVTIT